MCYIQWDSITLLTSASFMEGFSRVLHGLHGFFSSSALWCISFLLLEYPFVSHTSVLLKLRFAIQEKSDIHLGEKTPFHCWDT